jgi:hypothetical protein
LLLLVVDANPRGATNGRCFREDVVCCVTRVVVDCVHFVEELTKAFTFVNDEVTTTQERTNNETFMLNQKDAMGGNIKGRMEWIVIIFVKSSFNQRHRSWSESQGHVAI